MTNAVSRWILLAGVAILGMPLRADEPACPGIDPVARDLSRPQAGLRAFRDPVTGKLRPPTREEAAALARTQAQAAPEREIAFEVVVHPNGMKSVDLQGAFDQATVATRNPDGSIRMRCVPARSTADVGAAAAPRPAPEER